MVNHIDLRKTVRDRDIVLMADRAELDRIRTLGLMSGGVGRVPGEGAVARLTTDIAVAALVHGLSDIRVAIRAGVSARNHGRSVAVVLQGAGAEVAQFPEAFRHQRCSHYQKEKQAEQEQAGQAEEMLEIFEPLRHRLTYNAGRPQLYIVSIGI
jgi:hypothetical protein